MDHDGVVRLTIEDGDDGDPRAPPASLLPRPSSASKKRKRVPGIPAASGKRVELVADVLGYISTFLTVEELARNQRVCKRWKEGIRSVLASFFPAVTSQVARCDLPGTMTAACTFKWGVDRSQSYTNFADSLCGRVFSGGRSGLSWSTFTQGMLQASYERITRGEALNPGWQPWRPEERDSPLQLQVSTITCLPSYDILVVGTRDEHLHFFDTSRGTVGEHIVGVHTPSVPRRIVTPPIGSSRSIGDDFPIVVLYGDSNISYLLCRMELQEDCWGQVTGERLQTISQFTSKQPDRLPAEACAIHPRFPHRLATCALVGARVWVWNMATPQHPTCHVIRESSVTGVAFPFEESDSILVSRDRSLICIKPPSNNKAQHRTQLQVHSHPIIALHAHSDLLFSVDSRVCIFVWTTSPLLALKMISPPQSTPHFEVSSVRLSCMLPLPTPRERNGLKHFRGVRYGVLMMGEIKVTTRHRRKIRCQSKDLANLSRVFALRVSTLNDGARLDEANAAAATQRVVPELSVGNFRLYLCAVLVHQLAVGMAGIDLLARKLTPTTWKCWFVVGRAFVVVPLVLILSLWADPLPKRLARFFWRKCRRRQRTINWRAPGPPQTRSSSAPPVFGNCSDTESGSGVGRGSLYHKHKIETHHPQRMMVAYLILVLVVLASAALGFVIELPYKCYNAVPVAADFIAVVLAFPIMLVAWRMRRSYRRAPQTT